MTRQCHTRQTKEGEYKEPGIWTLIWSQGWWFIPAVPATQEAEEGGSFEPDQLGKRAKPHPKTKTKT